MSDYIELEMRMASLMAQQETSGFRFDLEAAERVKSELQEEMGDIEASSVRSISISLARSSHLNARTSPRATKLALP